MENIEENNFNTVLRNEFTLIHKDYCKNFKKFLKEFDKIFTSMTKEEYEQFIPCVENYAKIMNIVRLDLEEFMEDVNKSSTNGPQNHLVDDKLLKFMMMCYIMNN